MNLTLQLENNLETLVKHIIRNIKYGHNENIYQLVLCYELLDKGYKVQREDIIHGYYILKKCSS